MLHRSVSDFGGGGLSKFGLGGIAAYTAGSDVLSVVALLVSPAKVTPARLTVVVGGGFRYEAGP